MTTAILSRRTKAPSAQRSGVVDSSVRRVETHKSPTPEVSKWLLNLFSWYSRRYLQRHFHSFRVSKTVQSPANLHVPLVVYSNHASWWDPLVGLLLARECFPGKSVFAPMDAAALERYGFFKRLGAFGVEQGTRRGAAQFLLAARSILQQAENILWLTPQSRFADARERPVGFKPGIGHLPNRLPHLQFLPVGIEYVFWEERLPEILIRFGELYETRADEMQLAPQVWTEFFAGKLEETQDALATEARQRNPDTFCCLLRGKSGVNVIYDRWRALKSRWRGQTFQPEHGRL
ncbi:MAG: lysophospholipid acyltransferase family protein [Verrucomicrobiae bacterium]|nr:lysophospholipid acyltransferase family protein [Verrucomicrobiae bacterium]